jgi:hypothetical protein
MSSVYTHCVHSNTFRNVDGCTAECLVKRKNAQFFIHKIEYLYITDMYGIILLMLIFCLNKYVFADSQRHSCAYFI